MIKVPVEQYGDDISLAKHNRFFGFKEGKVMKKGYVLAILGVVLCALVFWLGGCKGYWAQPGETEAEGHRRHLRNLSLNQQQLSEDIDTVMLADQPSKLTDERIR